MTRKHEIKKLVRKWQGILGLQNWRLEVLFNTPPLNAFAHMSVQYHAEKQEAVLRIPPCTLRDENIKRFLESFIVHELTHLFLAVEDQRGENTVFTILLEQRTEQLTRAFCAAAKLPFEPAKF